MTGAYARTLNKVAETATGAGDPRADIESIAREIAQLYEAPMASVFLHHNDSRPRHVTGFAVSPSFLRTLDPISSGWESLVPSDARDPIIVSDIAAQGPTADICHWATSTGIATLALAPIASQGRALGALVLYHRQPYIYREEDRLVLRALAGLASPVVSRAHWAGGPDGAEGSNSALFNALGHELRTPLTAIMGFTQMIRKRLATAVPRDTRLLEQVDVLWVQSQRLNRLIDSFVDLGRIERGDFRISASRVELIGLLKLVAEQTLTQVGSRHSLTVDVPAKPVWLQADARRLEQVFGHLLMNATKYSPANVPIELTCEVDPDQGRALVRITDHGPGISSTRVKEIFQDHVPSWPLRTGGLGVGLYLSKVIVEAHGGHISIESSERGTAVTVALPVEER